jgi:polyadenylate-binding protein
VTEALLFDIFNAVGPVASVRVCRDAATRRSLGYAYVNFHRVEDAERALDTMNFKNIRSKPCRIMWSHRDPSLRKSGVGNIFVKNLAKSIDNKTLYDTFSMFGNILSCKVAVNSKRESLGYGFVHYESEESANNAIARVHGNVIAGEKVTVSAFRSKKERGGANRFRYTNIYVKNLPADCTKEALDKLFGQYGTITSSIFKEHKNRGFGFINFANAEEAQAAVDNLQDYKWGDKCLYVARAQKREEREKELRERFEQLKVERQKKYAGVNLYVKNLADTMDDARLKEEFSKFGAITSARIMRDANEKSRGFGFVCFSTPEEATKAVTEMNGRMVDHKPLYVALAQRKEARRAQLEAQHAARQKLGIPQPQMYPSQPPMFYQGMPTQRPMMFPQQMVSRRWNPNQAAGPHMMGRMGQPIGGYQLMPINGRGGPGGNMQQGGRGGGRNNNRRNQPGQGKGGGAGANQQRMPNGAPQIKYADNVRNRDQARQTGQEPNPQQTQTPPPAQQAPPQHEPLTIKALAKASEEQKKQMIGERLFPLISQRQPAFAGKITGMILEMDNGELIHLLESKTALDEKINEAIAVLSKVGFAAGAPLDK